MGTYVFLLSVAIIGNLFQRKRNIILLNVLVMGVLFIYCAFRGEYIGADTPTYLSIYSSAFHLDNYKNEYLFYSVIKWIRHLGYSAEDCQIVMAALTFFPLLMLFVKKSVIPSLSIILFIIAVNGYYLETYNIVRQSVATAFLLWAYVMAVEKRWGYTIVFFIMAIGFHNSSLIYLPLFLLALYCKFSYKVVVIAIISSLLFAFAFSSISFLTNIVDSLQGINILGFDKYSHFADYRLDMTRNMNGLITLLLPHSFLCLYAYKKKGDNMLVRLYFYGIVLLNIVSVMPTSYRMAYGLTSLELLIYPMVFKEAGKWRWAFLMLFIFLLAYWLMKLSSGGVDSALIPYRFM